MVVPASRFVVLTPAGAGGVAVVAVIGDDRHEVAASVLRTTGGRRALRPDVVPRLAELWVDGECIDQVLAVDRPELAQVEIHAHGSAAVLDRLGVERIRTASAARRLLLGALSDSQLALAFEQLDEPWSRFVAGLGELDAERRRAAILAAQERSRTAMAIATPCRVVICGAQNAGKSSLMNRLLFRERALAGRQAGLTRDPVRESTVLDGYPYELVDTAGEGETLDPVDVEAIRRARAERARAELRILVVDGARGPDATDRELLVAPCLVVWNKSDLGTCGTRLLEFEPAVSVSCLDPAGAPDVRARVGAALRELRALPVAGPVGGPA
ncbi:MAG: 50S ribosome-binding GTPase, partial [Planctomycetes bacterium]|nr:50S ribosome-binding GTPase [Planctomycetota bacterium]